MDNSLNTMTIVGLKKLLDADKITIQEFVKYSLQIGKRGEPRDDEVEMTGGT